MLLQDTVLFSPAVATQIRGGHIARLPWRRARSSCADVDGRPFPCSQTAAQWRGVAFWEVLSFAPLLLAHSVSGRAPPGPRALPLPLRCALPRRRLLDGLRRSCPARGALSLRIFAVFSCLGPCGLPRVPSDPPRATGFVWSTPSFSAEETNAQRARPGVGAGPGTRAQISDACLQPFPRGGSAARGERLELGIKKEMPRGHLGWGPAELRASEPPRPLRGSGL